MGMTIDKAIETIEYLKTQNSQLKSLDIAVDTMRKYQKIIDKYEMLCDSFVGLDGETISKQVDEFCIDTMRGLLGEYYADKVKQELKDANN